MLHLREVSYCRKFHTNAADASEAERVRQVYSTVPLAPILNSTLEYLGKFGIL